MTPAVVWPVVVVVVPEFGAPLAFLAHDLVALRDYAAEDLRRLQWGTGDATFGTCVRAMRRGRHAVDVWQRPRWHLLLDRTPRHYRVGDPARTAEAQVLAREWIKRVEGKERKP